MILLLVGSALGLAYFHWWKPPAVRAGIPMPIPMELSSVTSGTSGGLKEARLFAGPAGSIALGNSITLGDIGTSENVRLPSTDLSSIPRMEQLAQVPTHLAAIQDGKTALVLFATSDGLLRLYDPSTWKEVRTVQLDRPAYLLQLDAERRRLYAATTSAEVLRINELGERSLNERTAEKSQIEIYDLEAILTSNSVKPLHRLRLGANLTDLLLSPDRKTLYYLSESLHSSPLGRIDTQTWVRDESLELRSPGPGILTLAPDGSTLYCLASGRLYLIDTKGWQVREQFPINSSIQAVAVDPAGRLYLAERVRGIQLKIIDTKTRTTLIRCSSDIEGRPMLALSPDGKRIYVGSSSFIAGRIWTISFNEPPSARSVLHAQAGSDRSRLIRGALSITADGNYLITRTGQVFRVPA